MRPALALALLSSMIAPAALHASDSDVSTQPIRISTGVVAPVVLNSNNFSISADALSSIVTPKPAVVLGLTVNEKGQAEGVHIVKSVAPKVDEKVLHAVQDFRFRPATLNSQPVPVDLQLTVYVQR